MSTSKKTPEFPDLLQQFFMEGLIQQRNASPRTVSSYRDSFRILLIYAKKKLKKKPSQIRLIDLNAQFMIGFLQYLENERHNTVRSRNARFAAIRSFYNYIAPKVPADLGIIQSVLAIPMKKFNRPLIGFLTKDEIDAVLNAPNPTTWCGQRDQIMFTTLYNTGARSSELTNMKIEDVVLGKTSFVYIHGKGRKERAVPLWKSTAVRLRHWILKVNTFPDHYLFPSRSGNVLSPTGISDRLKMAVAIAEKSIPSLKKRKISLHLVRHSTATHLLQSGVDLAVIAIWLGHQSISTTHMYLDADLAMKEKALRCMSEPKVRSCRYKPNDKVLAFLEEL